MNWQCPRCETFNPAAEKQCEVCELAKPKRKRAAKTATKEADFIFVAPPISERPNSPAKPAESVRATTSSKVIDRAGSSSGAMPKITGASPGKPKTSEPPDVQPNATPGGAIVDTIVWLTLIGFNIYYIYDWAFVQKLGIGSLILGLFFLNLIILFVLGGIIEIIKRLTKPADGAK